MAKTLLFTGFRSRHDQRFFEKRVNTSIFAFINAKDRFKKGRKCCNLQGFGAATGKKLRKYQRFSAQKWPKHRYLQCFVPSFHVFLKLQKQCKYQHFLRSTCQKCCNLQCFFALLAKTLVFAVFCASRVQKVLVFTAFSAFVHGSRQRR